jgi:hypothetical protein
MVDRSLLVMVCRISSSRLSLVQRVFATIRGDIVGGAGIGGCRKGSSINLLAGELLDILMELLDDILEWGRVESGGQEHKNLVDRWMRQKRPDRGMLVMGNTQIRNCLGACRPVNGCGTSSRAHGRLCSEGGSGGAWHRASCVVGGSHGRHGWCMASCGRFY